MILPKKLEMPTGPFTFYLDRKVVDAAEELVRDPYYLFESLHEFVNEAIRDKVLRYPRVKEE